ncbi:DUF1254 domain-containing protein [Undibacterium sp. JH2W]|uniref:DUF1254 domain-containing protein n=1 Tax=Undibacterium sp. JH2W TaxID=3413037 RepID=UPI003BF457C9
MRLKRLKQAGWIILAAVLATAAILYAKLDYIKGGAEAYVFGYPLVMMELTRQTAAQSIGPENHLRRVRQFPDASFRDVVRPNVDTLYTTAFIDMQQGPWVFEMPANQQRYEVMPFMDAWTNVFAAPGSRMNSKNSKGDSKVGSKYLLVAANWQGQVPPGLQVLRAPTQIVWLIGRTQTNGAADFALVHALQDSLQLRSLADWQANKPEAPPVWLPQPEKALPPIVQMRQMDVMHFFSHLSKLMQDNPPATADAPMLEKMRHIGIIPGVAPDWSWLDEKCIALGRRLADWKIAQELKKPRDAINGWVTPPANLGNYGTDYNIRSVVAMIGLGANLPADAIYPSASVDSQNRPLDGSKRYQLHFPPDQLPPARAFWSVTAYGANDFLIDNSIQRHAIGSRDALAMNEDGSLDLYIQAFAPPDKWQTNWLPVKQGQGFVLNARLYWPMPAALEGRWHMPVLERLD